MESNLQDLLWQHWEYTEEIHSVSVIQIQYQKIGISSSLLKFHLLPLYVRRDIADMIFLMKIEIKLKVPFRRLRAPALLNVLSSRTRYRQNSFLPRSMRHLNKLYPSSSLDLFACSTRTATNILIKEVYSSIHCVILSRVFF